MKIYSRAAFMELPPGTIFAKGVPWTWEGLAEKHDTLKRDDGSNLDFIYTPLVDIEDGGDSGERAARCQEMLETGVSYPLNDTAGRDGCFDDEEVFLVYEKEDLAILAAKLLR